MELLDSSLFTFSRWRKGLDFIIDNKVYFIQEALGNKTYLSSASHGAGRTMSRTKAKEITTVNELESQMGGIIASTSKNVLDEAPRAYKDIKMVMKRQEGIVIETVDYFKPVINIKDDSPKRKRGK